MNLFPPTWMAFGLSLGAALFVGAAQASPQAAACVAPAASTEASPPARIYLSMEVCPDTRGQVVVGEGPYVYRFVVRDPQRIEQPYRRGSYQVELRNGHTFADGSAFYQGTADERGRTVIFRMAREVPPADWFIEPQVGQGANSQSMHFTEADGDGPAGMFYMLSNSGGSVFCGRTLPGGYSVRFRSRFSTTLSAHQGIAEADCKRLQQRLDKVLKADTHAARVAGLLAMMKEPTWQDHRALLQDKVETFTVRDGSEQDIRQMMARKTAASYGLTSTRHANMLNSLGYQLMTQSPPRLLPYANALLDESLALHTSAYNLDTKGWGLYLSGQPAQSLSWFERSAELFLKTCTSEDETAWLETQGHRAQALWSMGRRDEALDIWARAHMSTTDGSWTASLPNWAAVEPQVRSLAQRLREQGVAPVTCAQQREAVAPAPEEGAEDEAGEADEAASQGREGASAP